MKIWLILLIMLMLSGCDKPSLLSNVSKQNYQIVNAQDGSTYRLNSEAGGISLVTAKGIKAIPEQTIKLKIGEVYKLENNTDALYEGNGLFNTNTMAIADSIVDKYKSDTK